MQADTCIGGIDERSLLDVVLVCPIAQKTTQEFYNGNRSTNPEEALAFSGAGFFVAGRHSTVHGVGDSWWCDDDADRAINSNAHEGRANIHNVR